LSLPTTVAGRLRAHWAKPPAGRPDTVLGVVWTLVIAIDLLLLSNPLVLFSRFPTSLHWAEIATGVGLLLTLHRAKLPTMPVSIVAFLAWCLLSAVWSIDQTSSLEATWFYLQITLIAIVVGANVDSVVFAAGLALGGVLVVAASVWAFETQQVGAYYVGVDRIVMIGLGKNQNVLAYTLVIALVGCLSLALPRRRWTWVLWLTAVAALGYGLVRAGSATGYLCALCMAMVAVLFASPILRRRRRGTIAALIAAGIGVVGALLTVVALLGKDLTTVSDRMPFWEATIEATRDAPVAGFGWGAVWNNSWWGSHPNEVAEQIYAGAGLRLSHGHNNFVHVAPELGLVGVAIAVAIFVQLGVRAFGRSDRPEQPKPSRQYRALLAIGLVALNVFGLTEPMLTLPLGWWTVTVLLSLRVTAPPPPPRPPAGRHRADRRPAVSAAAE
jgi:O-antigen ligase